MRNLIMMVALISAPVFAAPPILVDPSTGKYLGTLSANPYDPNSTSNPYGRYGSKYSPDSINNRYGEYGNPYSNNSATNPYATNPPVIIHDDH
jgi:cell division protein FtsI/penicillin-binding protein 2